MKDILALEWEHDQVYCVQAAVSGSRVRVRRLLVLPKPAAGPTGSGAFPVDWLKSRIADLGIPSGDAIVTLPRDEAVVKRIELPDVPDDELPVMVRFQAGAKSAVSLDELGLDFLPLPKRGEAPGRDVLVATIPNVTLEEVRTCCQLAGLNPVAIGLTPVAIAELAVRAIPALSTDPMSQSLVVARHGSRVEISVLQQGRLAFSHSARLSDQEGANDAQAIVSAVSRALVALRGAVGEMKVTQAFTLLPQAEHPAVAEAIERRLACPVERLDPFKWVEHDGVEIPAEVDASVFAGPVSFLLSRAQEHVSGIDFLNPRKPPVKRDNRRRKLVIAGAGAGALAVVLLLLQFWRLSELDATIESLQRRNAELAQTLKEGQPTLQAANLVDAWRGDQVDALVELVALAQRMPATDRVYLDSLQITQKGPARPARIQASGFARDQKDVMELAAGFHTDDRRYRVMPHKAVRNSADSYYPWRMDGQEILMDVPDPTKEGGKKGKKAAARGASGATSRPAAAKSSDGSSKEATQ
jgi:Tfp pilus assembly PilM family ATPase